MGLFLFPLRVSDYSLLSTQDKCPISQAEMVFLRNILGPEQVKAKATLEAANKG